MSVASTAPVGPTRSASQVAIDPPGDGNMGQDGRRPMIGHAMLLDEFVESRTDPGTPLPAHTADMQEVLYDALAGPP